MMPSVPDGRSEQSRARAQTPKAAQDKRPPKSAIQRAAFEMTGNSVAAQILAALWWWEPYAKVSRDQKLWVVKTDKDFIQQDGVTAKARAIRNALARLTADNLIETTRGPHPNGRAPNSRYLRLRDGVVALLESGIKSGSKRLVSNRTDADAITVSNGLRAPIQRGTKSRFHIQEDSNDTSTIPAPKFETREAGNENENESVRREESSSCDLKISAELLRIQNAFNEGCQLQSLYAPFLNHPRRVQRLQAFWTDCQAQKLSIEIACMIAKHFAKHYSAQRVAEELARPREKVSETPDHFNLSLCSNFAISTYRDAVIADHVLRELGDRPSGGGSDPKVRRWDEECSALRDRYRNEWPNLEDLILEPSSSMSPWFC